MSPELAAPNDTPAQPVIEPEGASVYVAPTAVPPPTQHPTFELETVRIAPEVDPRRSPTIVLPRRQPPVAAESPSVAPAVSSPRPVAEGSAAVSLWLVAALAGLALVAGSAAARMILVYAGAPRAAVAAPAAVATVTDDLPSGAAAIAAFPAPRPDLPAASLHGDAPTTSTADVAPPPPASAPRRAGGRAAPAAEPAPPARSTRRIF